jgi:hypothetical protein
LQANADIESEHPFRTNLGTDFPSANYHCGESSKEIEMRKLVLALAALAALGFASAAPAMADPVVVVHHHYHHHGMVMVAPHHHHHHSKTVIIKHN